MSGKKSAVHSTIFLMILALTPSFQTAKASNGTWQKITGSVPQPSARYNSATTAAVYASSINSMVFFGGYDFNTFLDDGWKLDLATQGWSPLTSSTPGPAGRLGHGAVYDAAHDRMVLYGGVAANYVEFQDLWSYEFGSSRWVELPQASLKPGDRLWASVVYNPKDTTMVLFGGQDLDGNIFNDLWILDLNNITWRRIAPEPGWPDVRLAALVALDEQANTLWMFGGYQGFEFNELWSLDLTTLQWTEHPMGSPAPPARNGAPAFFEPASRSMVIFGGVDHNNNRGLNDLWAYSVDNGTWQQLSTSGDIPSPRHNCLAAFAPAQNRFVLFGGRDFPAARLFGDGYSLTLNPLPTCTRGDMNGDQNLTPADLVLLLNCVYLETGRCDLCFADASCNGFLSAVDVVALLNAIFLTMPIDCSS